MEEDSSGAKKGESDEKKKWQVGYSTAASKIDLLGLDPVFGIRIRMFLGLPDPHPDSLFTSTAPVPAPNPSLFS
jgi:hypothetical protein